MNLWGYKICYWLENYDDLTKFSFRKSKLVIIFSVEIIIYKNIHHAKKIDILRELIRSFTFKFKIQLKQYHSVLKTKKAYVRQLYIYGSTTLKIKSTDILTEKLFIRVIYTMLTYLKNRWFWNSAMWNLFK